MVQTGRQTGEFQCKKAAKTAWGKMVKGILPKRQKMAGVHAVGHSLMILCSIKH